MRSVTALAGLLFPTALASPLSMAMLDVEDLFGDKESQQADAQAAAEQLNSGEAEDSVLSELESEVSMSKVDTGKKSLRCGDHIAIKSKVYNKWWTTRTRAVLAMGTEVHDTEQYTIHCQDRNVGDQIHYGDPIALENLHNMAWLGDGVHQLKVRMRQSRPNEWFDIMTTKGKGLNNRDPVMNGDEIFFRNPKSDEAVSAYYAGRLGHMPFGGDASTGVVTSLNPRSKMKVFLVCPSYKNKVCNNKGSCVNNKCKCFAKYEGAACHRQRKFGVCHAVGDPHWKTWDGLYINLYSYGEYLQYYNPRGTDNEAVTAYLVKLRSTSVVSVQRDIMVRRKDEVVKVVWPTGQIQVNCKDVTAAAKKTGPTGFKTDSGLKLVYHKMYWFITSPSGLQVQVRTYGWGQNLWVRIHEPRDGQQRGMCGDFDGNPRNDVGLPARKAYNQPADEYISSIYVPPKFSLRSCTAAGKDYQYFLGEQETVGLDPSNHPPAGSKVDFGMPRPDSVLTAIQEKGDPLNPEQRARVNLALKTCKNKEKALKACARLISGEGARTDGRSEAADCVEDECETDDATEFVGAAIAAAKEENKVNKGVLKATAAVNALEKKEEKTVKRFVGAPDAEDKDKGLSKEEKKELEKEKAEALAGGDEF